MPGDIFVNSSGVIIGNQSHTDNYWGNVVSNWNIPGSTNSGWSVSALNPVNGNNMLQYWMDVLDQPNLPPQVLDIPGCSPVDFSAGGGSFMFVAGEDYTAGIGPMVQDALPYPGAAQPQNQWDDYRKSHNFGLVAFTLEESYFGVGLPGTETIDWWQGIPSAITQYPQYSALINNSTCGPLDVLGMGPFQSMYVGFGGFWAQQMGLLPNTMPGAIGGFQGSACLTNFGLKVFRELNMYPSTFTPQQINDGWTKCYYYLHKFIAYIDAQINHVHAGVPGSYNGVNYNANGSINKWWMYKYLRLNAKAHFMQSAHDACGCGGFLMNVGWHLFTLPPSSGIFPFYMNGVTYTYKMIDPNFKKDPIHTLMFLLSGKPKKQTRRKAEKLLQRIRKNATSKQYISEEEEEVLFKRYLKEEDHL